MEGPPAWRVRHLLSLALCQSSEDCKPEELNKILAKALELATAANLHTLQVGGPAAGTMLATKQHPGWVLLVAGLSSFIAAVLLVSRAVICSCPS